MSRQMRRCFSAGELATRQRNEIREELNSPEAEDPRLGAIRALKDGIEVPLNVKDFRFLLANNMLSLACFDTKSAVSYWIRRGKWPPSWTSDMRILLATSNLLDSYDNIPADAAELGHQQLLEAAAATAAYEWMLDDERDEVLTRPPTPGRGWLDSDSSDKEETKKDLPDGASGSRGRK